jgi:hypothetical protein
LPQGSTTNGRGNEDEKLREEEAPRRTIPRFWLLVLLSVGLHALFLSRLGLPDFERTEAQETVTLHLLPPEEAPTVPPPAPPEPLPREQAARMPLTTGHFDPERPESTDLHEPPGEDLAPLITHEQPPRPEEPSPREERAAPERPPRRSPEGLPEEDFFREPEVPRPEPADRALSDPRDPRFRLPDQYDIPDGRTATPGDPFAVQVMNARGYNIWPYVLVMKSRFRSNWQIPPIAYTGASGAVAFELIIRQNGAVTITEQVASTGNSAYELASRRAVELSDPLPALPEDFPEEQLIIRFGFYYNWRERR